MSSKRQTEKRWKKALLEARQQADRGLTCLFRQTKLLIEIFDDAEFRADAGLRDDLQAAEWLDAEFPNAPLKFLEMRAILQAFPEEKDWREQSLQEMFASIKPSKPEGQVQHARMSIKKADYEKACEERDHYKARAKYLDEQVAELEADRDTHRQEIAKLKGRIHELERLVARELAAI